MNETIKHLLNHRSVREFENKSLSEEQVSLLVASAQAASTSSYMQAYSIIGVSDPVKKQKIADIARGQSFVVNNGHFFIFCGDLNRHQVAGQMEGKEISESIENTEKFMVATIDAGLAAQNMAVAAESLGLGICYVGGIRNDLETITDLLDLPPYVVPLFGLAIGYPAVVNGQKPRLPLENIYHENGYQSDKAVFQKQLEAYNETTQDYYDNRTAGERMDRWTSQITSRLQNKQRMYMQDFVKSRGMNRK